jgi:RNA polymerase sigma-70 factor (ECF subfamily)
VLVEYIGTLSGFGGCPLAAPARTYLPRRPPAPSTRPRRGENPPPATAFRFVPACYEEGRQRKEASIDGRAQRAADDTGRERDRLAACLAAVGAGDRAALAEVYRRTSSKLFAVCIRILAERGEAEDVLQEVYLTVWQRAAAFEPTRASPMTWLITIARNRAIDRLRARGARPQAAPVDLAEAVADPAVDALQRLADDDERRRLAGCLDTLEEEPRRAIRTAFLEGRTYEELAAARGVPLGTMKSWIRRGLLKLRACLEQ